MDTKISSDFWSDPDIEPQPAEVKYAALWLLTNSRISLCGYAEVTPERFAFETGTPSEGFARALEALPKSFERIGKGYLARRYIHHQFGSGPALARSNLRIAIANAMRGCPAAVADRVLEVYPELRDTWEDVSRKALLEGSPSPTQGQRVRERVREGERAGERERVRGAGERGAKPRQRRRKPGAVLPSELPEPVRSRLLAVGALKHRQPTTAWQPNEIDAFHAARLDVMSDADFAAQIEPLRAYYGATMAPDRDFRRREVLTLLNHWAGELDKAKAFARDNNDGLRRL